VTIYQDMMRKITDVFTKKEDSNIGKLILLLSEPINLLNDTFYKIENWRDLNQAEGNVLDAIGSNFGQKRGQLSDELMRVLIKARIARNESDGTFDKMIEALARTVNTTPDKVKIKALWSEGEPAAIMIEGVPLNALNSVGMTANEFGYIAQQIVAAGVRVASIDLSGTFTLSSQFNVLETSTEFGLAPLDQSTGGTLGASFDPGKSINLPI
jgi:phage-related tail protein